MQVDRWDELDPCDFLPPMLRISQVAAALGNSLLAGKCRINEAYNYIWMGQYAQARRIIRDEVGLAGRDRKPRWKILKGFVFSHHGNNTSFWLLQ